MRFQQRMNLFLLMSCKYMTYHVFVSKSFQKKFHQLQNNYKNSIRKSLKELQNDPYTSRASCDIKALEKTKPKKYRLRVGNYRIIYIVEKKEVKIIDLLRREIGYSRIK